MILSQIINAYNDKVLKHVHSLHCTKFFIPAYSASSISIMKSKNNFVFCVVFMLWSVSDRNDFIVSFMDQKIYNQTIFHYTTLTGDTVVSQKLYCHHVDFDGEISLKICFDLCTEFHEN